MSENTVGVWATLFADVVPSLKSEKVWFVPSVTTNLVGSPVAASFL